MCYLEQFPKIGSHILYSVVENKQKKVVVYTSVTLY